MQAINFHGHGAFPLGQLVWPDKQGRFPDDPRCDAGIRAGQALLREPRDAGEDLDGSASSRRGSHRPETADRRAGPQATRRPPNARRTRPRPTARPSASRRFASAPTRHGDRPAFRRPTAVVKGEGGAPALVGGDLGLTPSGRRPAARRGADAGPAGAGRARRPGRRLSHPPTPGRRPGPRPGGRRGTGGWRRCASPRGGVWNLLRGWRSGRGGAGGAGGCRGRRPSRPAFPNGARPIGRRPWRKASALHGVRVRARSVVGWYGVWVRAWVLGLGHDASGRR
jgi:hypothetical protein